MESVNNAKGINVNLAEKIKVETVCSYEEERSNFNVAYAYAKNSTSDDKLDNTPSSEQINKEGQSIFMCQQDPGSLSPKRMVHENMPTAL